MLEGLPAIDWDNLTHAYGQAGNIPALIRGLASPDPEEWVGALSGLYDTLCHQTCTVYQATAPAVPFLIELLGHKRVRCRGGILLFLGDAARATSYLAAHSDLSADEKERETEEFQQQLAEELEWGRQTREAVWNGLDVYLDLLADLDKRLRVMVPYTLGLLVEHAGEEMPEGVRRRDPYRLMAEPLARQFEEEPNELVRASLVFGLNCLAPHRPEVGPLLERLLVDPAAGRAVKLSAALCLSGGGRKPSPVALDVLVGALQTPKETNRLFDSDEPGMEGKHHPLAKAYRQAGTPLGEEAGVGHDPDDVGKDEDFTFPWLRMTGGPTQNILWRLADPDADCLVRILPAMIPYLDQANPYTAESICRPILRLVFGDRKVTPQTTRADLTPGQAEVLKHLYDNLLLWATAIANVGIAFRKFGLTDRRSDWARLLGLEERPLTDPEIEAILLRIAPEQQYLSDRPRIKRLNLREIGTPAFLPHLKQFSELEELDLWGVKLKDEDLDHLAHLPRLRMLHIPGSAITDVGAEVLARLSNLADLNLSGARLTDKGLDALQRLDKLHTLWLWKVPVSDEAVARFNKARPRCKVSR